MNGGKRNSHYLRKNKSIRWPSRFIFFDCETVEREVSEREKELRLLFGVAKFVRVEEFKGKTYEEEIIFTSGEELADFIEKHCTKKKSLYIFAANIAFDLRASGLILILRRRGWEIDFPIVRQKVFFTKAKKACYGSIKFIDVFNYGIESVAQAGKIVGLEKLPMPKTREVTDSFIEYCRRDVEIIRTYVLRLREQFRKENLAAWSFTISGLAFKTYRHRFMTDKILIHNNEEALRLEREGYYGGRCECFRIGTFTGQTFYQLDVNSLYPFVMREFEYPIKLVNYCKDITLQALVYGLKKYYVIAKVRLKTNEELFPVRLNNRLCYVKGDFITVLHHAELVRALEANAVVEVKEAAFYRKGKIFCDYVDYFYSRRIEAKDKGNDDLAYIYKLLLNSLYGKFGQKGYRRKVEKICDSDSISVEEMISLETRKMRQIINWFGTLIYEEEEGESYNSVPAIAGAVTAYGREYLLRLMKKAGLEHVFYVDTDSLIVDEEGYENLMDLVDSKELGKLKVEGVGDYLVIRNLKDYTLGNKQKIKGVKKGAVQIAENIYQEEKFEGFRGALKRGKLDSVIVEKSIKVLSRKYQKGIVGEDGRVLPFTLSPLLSF